MVGVSFEARRDGCARLARRQYVHVVVRNIVSGHVARPSVLIDLLPSLPVSSRASVPCAEKVQQESHEDDNDQTREEESQEQGDELQAAGENNFATPLSRFDAQHFSPRIHLKGAFEWLEAEKNDYLFSACLVYAVLEKIRVVQGR